MGEKYKRGKSERETREEEKEPKRMEERGKSRKVSK